MYENVAKQYYGYRLRRDVIGEFWTNTTIFDSVALGRVELADDTMLSFLSCNADNGCGYVGYTT